MADLRREMEIERLQEQEQTEAEALARAEEERKLSYLEKVRAGEVPIEQDGTYDNEETQPLLPEIELPTSEYRSLPSLFNFSPEEDTYQ